MPTILLPRVLVPSTPSMLLSFIAFVLYLSCEKNENKQKEAGFGPFFLMKSGTSDPLLTKKGRRGEDLPGPVQFFLPSSFGVYGWVSGTILALNSW